MTDHTELIARLRKDDLFWEAPITCRSEAADALEAAQAEIEAVRKANIDCVNHFDALRIDYDKALARIAKLEPKRNVSPPSEALVLHKMRYHFWDAEDDEPADFELFDAGVECDTCIDVALVRQDRLDELIAAGASPQPSQADAQDAARYRWLRPALTRGGNVEDSGELVAAFSHLAHTPTEPEFDAAIDAAMKESK